MCMEPHFWSKPAIVDLIRVTLLCACAYSSVSSVFVVASSLLTVVTLCFAPSAQMASEVTAPCFVDPFILLFDLQDISYMHESEAQQKLNHKDVGTLRCFCTRRVAA